ncbi:hypothetical protein ACS126_03550 [Sphingobacterium lactis]|uniref:hypothetical protein n=1 Tax=Sphingobacterium TaxID=28453 RepID=UPI0021A41399|nr:hypothetical protein [Sphingobacterium hotanense]MCT1526078.1 hypothetical protein [Sphingobacterium hotanense]
MKKKFTFEIESLLTGIEMPRGPIDQMLFANRFAEHMGWFRFSYLARVTFAEPTINTTFPGGNPLDETLLIANYTPEGIELHLCVRGGRSCLRVAAAYLPKKEVIVCREYTREILLRKLNDKEIEEIFAYVWDNMEVIYPKPGRLED